MTFKLPAGRFRAGFTATKDGAKLRWSDKRCDGCPESGTCRSVCQFDGTGGDLRVENPTTFGLGASVDVTLRVVTE